MEVSIFQILRMVCIEDRIHAKLMQNSQIFPLYAVWYDLI